MSNIEKLKILTGESNDTLLEILLADAMEMVLSYTNRGKMIPELEYPVRELALIAYNRMGTEGNPEEVKAEKVIALKMLRSASMMFWTNTGWCE